MYNEVICPEQGENCSYQQAWCFVWGDTKMGYFHLMSLLWWEKAEWGGERQHWQFFWYFVKLFVKLFEIHVFNFNIFTEFCADNNSSAHSWKLRHYKRVSERWREQLSDQFCLHSSNCFALFCKSALIYDNLSRPFQSSPGFVWAGTPSGHDLQLNWCAQVKPLIGPDKSRDLNTGLWLVRCHTVSALQVKR